MTGSDKSAAGERAGAPLREIGFLLIEDFPLMGLGSALEVLRHANRFAGEKRYDYRTYAPQLTPVRASNGLAVQSFGGLDPEARPDMLFVCAGLNYQRSETPEIKAWLRRLARGGVVLGGISSGAFLLAAAGLLEGRRCAVHWEYSGVFRERFPEIDLTDNVFVIDRDRYTCSGGAATIDMMLRIVSDDLGPGVAARVAETMLVDRVRSTMDKQDSAALYRAKARSKALAKAIEAMEGALDSPLSMMDLAEHAGLTRRQLHRLFRQHTGGTPTDFYRDLRLRRARSLLQETPAKVIDVALACGFGSHSHFTKVYREHFGVSPLKDRRADP